MRDADVWLLKIKRANAPGLKPASGIGQNDWTGVGEFSCQNQPMARVASDLEGYFGITVIDETGLNGRFDIKLQWDEQSPRQNPDGLKQALLDQLGLELVPGRARRFENARDRKGEKLKIAWRFFSISGHSPVDAGSG